MLGSETLMGVDSGGRLANTLKSLAICCSVGHFSDSRYCVVAAVGVLYCFVMPYTITFKEIGKSAQIFRVFKVFLDTWKRSRSNKVP